MKHWNYQGDADITIGEIHVSKAPKVLLFLLIGFLICVITAAIIYKDYIAELFVTPQIILSDSEVSIELFSDFDPNKYIRSVGKNLSITGDEVDTSKVNAEYTVIYNTWNTFHNSSASLKVKVIDDKAPTITIKSNNKLIALDKSNSFTLISGKSTATTLGTLDFDISKDLMIEVSDNNDKEDELLKSLKISPEKPDFTLDNKEFSKNITLNFSVQDSSGLTSDITVIITVINGSIDIQNSSSISSSNSQPVSSQSSSSSSQHSNTTSSTQSQQSSNTQSNTPQSSSKPVVSSKPPVISSTTSKPVVPSTPSGAYINGVHDISVPVGTGLQTIVQKLLEGVYGSGYVTCEYRHVNPTIAGVYTVTFTSSDGITKTCTVTVTE